MSKPWRPEEFAAASPIDEVTDLQNEWTRTSGYWREAVREPLPHGAKFGLVLLGLACLILAAGMYQAFGPLEPVAPEVLSSGHR